MARLKIEIAAGIVAVAVIQWALVHIGEPQSVWLWCDFVGICAR